MTAKSCRNFIRKFIMPPFWILEYRHTGNGRSESCSTSLLADPTNRIEAEREARAYVEARSIFKGEYFFSVRVARWWERIY